MAICLFEGSQNSLAHALAQILGRPLKRRNLPEEDNLARDANCNGQNVI